MPDEPQQHATKVIQQLQDDIVEAQDNMLCAKVMTSHFANWHCGPKEVFIPGDKAMLSTFHQRHEYTWQGKKRTAKFFPHYDGPYSVTATHLAASMYTLDLPNNAHRFPTFHSSEL